MTNNVSVVTDRIRQAAMLAGRAEDSVALLPVTKYLSMDQVRELRDMGFTRMAESKPQQLAARAEALPDIEWVMIGRLQTNKAGLIVRFASESQSVASLKIAEALSKRAERELPILLQVNVSGEESKAGFRPDQIHEALQVVNNLPGLRIEGFMTMAPMVGGSAAARQTFRALRELQESEAPHLQRLSMGMSNDFESAIAEGATEVRIGSALFGE